MNSFTIKAIKARFLQKFLGKPLEIKKSWENTPADFHKMVDFLNWFDRTDSIEDCLKKAESDWKYRFANHSYFGSLPKNSALEIGFGGGRLLSQSSKQFKSVYGVDIHRNFKMTEEFLRSQNVTNYKLLHRDDIKSVPDNSIDLVYSFIVFQHFDKMSEVDFYLSQIERVLSKQGIAHIYFGKNPNDGIKTVSENDFRLRDCSLFISPEIMRETIAKNFSVLSWEDNLPRDPVTNSGESVQAMIVFRKKQ